MKFEQISHSEFNLVNHQTHLEGTLRFEGHTRVQGTLKGDIHCEKGSTLILAENGSIEGTLSGDVLHISGFFRGQMKAETEILIHGSARVFGELESPKIKIDSGAHFEGVSRMLKFATESNL